MKSALIGYTGFVGSNLADQYEFDDLYNSSNIDSIKGKSYDLVVSAGTRAEKWRINQEPEKDLGEINNLIENLKSMKTTKLVLISTIDVYKSPVGVDEDTQVETEGLHAYGANRYYLEQFCQDNFDSTIIRLPGLFGPGLKKNVIYDLLNNNNVEKIHHGGSFQYYNLLHIWRDIKIALDNEVGLINFATEPIKTEEIATQAFGMKDFTNEPEGVTAGSYDMHSKYADLYHGSDGYLYLKQQVLDEIATFVKSKQDA